MFHHVHRSLALGLLASLALAACSSEKAPTSEPELVVYSSRAEQLIKPLFDQYTAETGVEIQYTTDKEQPLIERLKAEGEATPASIFLTVDAGNLWHAAEQGVLRSIDSESLRAAIPAHLRDPEGYWFGLSVRARTIVYDPTKVDASELSSYADLAEDSWKGRLCLRTSKKVYNQSLVAMLIAEHGVSKTEDIVRGWVDNLAEDVFSNDTKLMEAILDGRCELGIVNSYYYGRLQRDNDQALSLRLFWPSEEVGGVHVNISGAGITRHAPAPEQALAFIEWMAGSQGQGLLAGSNLEFPANPGVDSDPMVASWGEFSQSQMPLHKAGELQAEAVQLMGRVGYR